MDFVCEECGYTEEMSDIEVDELNDLEDEYGDYIEIICPVCSHVNKCYADEE